MIKGVGDVITGRGAGRGDAQRGGPLHPHAHGVDGVRVQGVHGGDAPQACGQGHDVDNVGLNVKNLPKENMPRVGDVMIYKKDDSLKAAASFVCQVQTLDIPGELKPGYSPIGFVRTGRSACKLTKIDWKMGKETGGKKMEDPVSLKSNEA